MDELYWVLKPKPANSACGRRHLVLTVILYIFIPKASSRCKYGHLQGHFAEAAQSVSVSARRITAAITTVDLCRPSVESLSLLHRYRRHQHIEQRGIQINLSPWKPNSPALDFIRESKIWKRSMASSVHAAGEDLTVEDRVSRTQYQYTLEDPDQRELNYVDGQADAKLQAIPELRDLATTSRLPVGRLPHIDRVTASAWASRRKRSTRCFTMLLDSAKFDALHPGEPVPHRLETQPEFQKNPSKLQDIYVRLLWPPTALTTGSSGTQTARRRRLPAIRFLCCAQPFAVPIRLSAPFCQS